MAAAVIGTAATVKSSFVGNRCDVLTQCRGVVVDDFCVAPVRGGHVDGGVWV